MRCYTFCLWPDCLACSASKQPSERCSGSVIVVAFDLMVRPSCLRKLECKVRLLVVTSMDSGSIAVPGCTRSPDLVNRVDSADFCLVKVRIGRLRSWASISVC